MEEGKRLRDEGRLRDWESGQRERGMERYIGEERNSWVKVSREE